MNKNEQPTKENKTFNKVNFIEKYDFSYIEPKKQLWDLNKELVEKAYKNICIMWNKDYKSRGFLKHLISSFFPINNFNRMIKKGDKEIRCAILGIKLTGVVEISETIAKLSTERLFISAKYLDKEDKTYSKEDSEKINQLLKECPIECKNGSVANFSENSTKFLSQEAIHAFQIFIEHLLLNGDKEMSFTINKRRISSSQENISSDKKLTEKEVNKVSKAITYGLPKTKLGDNLDKTSFDALNKLKQQLEDKENGTK
jgi:hypothetical protein